MSRKKQIEVGFPARTTVGRQIISGLPRLIARASVMLSKLRLVGDASTS